jgi:fused signal recognition particle receptor
MFKFLKNKLKKAVSKFSKEVENEAKVEEVVDKPDDKPIQEKISKEKLKEKSDEKSKEIKLSEDEELEDESELKHEEEVKSEIPGELEDEESESEPAHELSEQLEDETKPVKKKEAELIIPETESEEDDKPEEDSEGSENNDSEEEVKEEEVKINESKEEVVEVQEKPKVELVDSEIAPEPEVEEKEKEESADLEPEEKEVIEEAPVKKKGFFGKLFSKEEPKKEVEKESKKKTVEKSEKKKDKKKTKKEHEDSEEKKKTESEKHSESLDVEEPKGLFGKLKHKLTTIHLSEDKFNDLFWDLELAMLENNVAVEVIEKIKEDLREELTTGRVTKKKIDEIIIDTLRSSIKELFIGNELNLLKEIKDKKPFVISFIGVNGSGKTTTMAKIAHMLLKNKLKIVFAASDTFRAAAIQQLEEHANKLGVKMIKHDYESDPAAVAFDAVKHAKAKKLDVVLIDTAGRLHSNDNLMNELKKLIRVNKPDMKIFIGESITGNDCVEQAKLFDEAVGIDAIVLAKADVDEKGGAAISVSYVTKKPILYLGTGQTYDDLKEFKSELVLENIGL